MSGETPGLVKEGQATVKLPQGVFYNPVQEFNRDLTIVVISEYERLRREERATQRTRKHVESTACINGSSMDTEEVGADAENAEKSNTEVERNEVISSRIDEAEKVQADVEERVAGTVYSDGLAILEGLAASGLRSVRFCKEIPGISRVVANDCSREAIATMKHNIELNGVQEMMSASCNDASMVMHLAAKSHKDLYDVIDLDPYGGPTQFLDGAVKAINHGGLLCVTCTDMAILCGNASEKCFAAYGAMSVKTKSCHEVALRIVLRAIDGFANRYGKYIVPLLSVSVDFYCRVFVRVFTGPRKAKESASKSAMLYECSGCGAHHFQPLGRIVETESAIGPKHKKFTFGQGPPVNRNCDECGQVHHIGGPLWSDPIHDKTFVKGVIERAKKAGDTFGTSKRIIGMMSVVEEELSDVPLYYLPDAFCGVVHTTSPGFLTLRSAILHAGYRVSLSHAAINSIKTDAPPSVLWDIMRCWTKLHPVNEKRITEGTPCSVLLSKEPKLQANFELHEDAEPESKKQGLLRYQNSKKDWGPKARGTNDFQAQSDKRKANQNKRGEKRRKTVDVERMKQYYCATYRRTGCCSYGDGCRYNHNIPLDSAGVQQTDTEKSTTDMG